MCQCHPPNVCCFNVLCMIINQVTWQASYFCFLVISLILLIKLGLKFPQTTTQCNSNCILMGKLLHRFTIIRKQLINYIRLTCTESNISILKICN